MKKINLPFVLLSAMFFSLMPLAYQRLQERNQTNLTIHKKRADAAGNFKRERKGIEVNGHRYDGFEKYAYIDEAFRRGQIDINEPPKYKQYEVGHAKRELEKAILASAGKRTKSDVTFTERGPSNFPGRTRGLIVDITDPTQRTWFGASIGGGLWKTTNAGNTWTELTAGMPNLATTWIAQAKSNPSTMYASTGEKVFTSISGSNGMGLLKSVDNGATWDFLPSTSREEFANINRVIVDPNNESIILVATAEKKFFEEDAGKNYIWRSEDGGSSWQQMYTSNVVIPQIIADPKDFNKQYGSLNNGKVIKSIDGGLSWSEPISLIKSAISAQSGIFDQLVIKDPSYGRVELAIAQNNTAIIYASVHNPIPNTATTGAAYLGSSELLVSFDGGNTWTKTVDTSLPTKANWLGSSSSSTQGNYDNAVLVNPLNDSIVYLAGVGIDQFKIGTVMVRDTLETLDVTIENADKFFELYNAFADPGPGITKSEFVKVEIRFGVTQKAHRFTVPEGATSGVPNGNYTYRDYVDVPFQVWDVDNNRQLMASFRDNNQNGIFDIARTSNQSRSYIFVNNIPYNATTPDENIAANGGHVHKNSYLVWLITPTTAAWDASAIQEVATIRLKFERSPLVSNFGKFTKVANPYERQGNNYVGPNAFRVLHPDHHNLVAMNITSNTFSILNANDGGIYMSDTSATPGLKNNGWHFRSKGYNTATYYGADKSPTEERYIGGPQDQSTNLSPKGINATAATEYKEVGTGDGFEVIWHATDPNQIIWSSYNNFFIRTEDGGDVLFTANNGQQSDGPFVSRLSNNSSQPDVLFSVGRSGVYRSDNFGRNWNYNLVDDARWSFWSAIDVEVSLASTQVVWAGGAMINTPNPFHIFVSKDGGVNFEATKNFGDMGVSTGIYSHPFDFKSAYVLFAVPGNPKILRTKDLGQTWVDITQFENGTSKNGFPDVATYSLVVMPNDTNHIWVGTEIGIVESLDGGESWALLNNPNFRAVSVWDMKIKGDQIVIATHGRGIWSATMPVLANAPQPNIVLAPILKSVQQNLNEFSLALNFEFRAIYDSFQIQFDGQKVFSSGKNDNIGAESLRLPLNKTGQIAVRLVAFKDGLTFPTEVISVLITPFSPIATKYVTTFESGQADWTMDGFSIGQSLGFFNNILRTTPSPYPEAQSLGLQELNLISVLNTPIKIANTKATIIFKEVVLVEIGEPGTKFGDAQFWDYVIVEGSKNGSVWVPFFDGYDSSADPEWLTAYNEERSGRPAMFRTRTINMLSKFSAGDTVQIRFRLYSDPLTNGWGWAIDDLYIQEDPPVVSGLNNPEVEKGISVYPIPSFGHINLSINNVMQGKVNLRVLDYSGKEVMQQELMNRTGVLEERISLDRLSFGVYILELDNGKERVTRKILKF